MVEPSLLENRKWLNSLTNFERRLPEKYNGSSFDTTRYRRLLEELGNPQQLDVPAVQILGTDGKGSTLAFLEALLDREGKTTKSFISPHLKQPEERFRVRGENVSTSEFLESLGTIRSASEGMEGLTYFEALNAAFWVWVRNDPPDYILLETGLGGRLDTTTVSEPVLKILTRLERDHFKILGSTMERIAGEKLAALRPEAKTLIAPQSPYLTVQIVAYLHDRRIPFEWVEEAVTLQVVGRQPERWTIQTRLPNASRLEFRTSLLGDHQAENLASAVLAFRHLTGAFPEASSEPIDLIPLWNGRCQVLTRAGETWVLDGSHTAQGGQALRVLLDQLFPDRPRSFFFNSTRDRFPWCYLRNLVRMEDSLNLVEFPHERVWQAAQLEERLLEQGWNDHRTPAIRTLPLSSVFEQSQSERVRICCGSLYWVGEALDRLGSLPGPREV